MTVTGLFSAKRCKSSVKMAILQVCDDGSKIIIVYYTGCYATLTGLDTETLCDELYRSTIADTQDSDETTFLDLDEQGKGVVHRGDKR
jgi:hypothetical protein